MTVPYIQNYVYCKILNNYKRFIWFGFLINCLKPFQNQSATTDIISDCQISDKTIRFRSNETKPLKHYQRQLRRTTGRTRGVLHVHGTYVSSSSYVSSHISPVPSPADNIWLSPDCHQLSQQCGLRVVGVRLCYVLAAKRLLLTMSS